MHMHIYVLIYMHLYIYIIYTCVCAYLNAYTIVGVEMGICITIDMHFHAEHLHSLFMSLVRALVARIIRVMAPTASRIKQDNVRNTQYGYDKFIENSCFVLSLFRDRAIDCYHWVRRRNPNIETVAVSGGIDVSIRTAIPSTRQYTFLDKCIHNLCAHWHR